MILRAPDLFSYIQTIVDEHDFGPAPRGGEGRDQPRHPAPTTQVEWANPAVAAKSQARLRPVEPVETVWSP
jgi:hypothetical protein